MNNENNQQDKNIVPLRKQELTKPSSSNKLTRKALELSNKLKQQKASSSLAIPLLKKFDFETVRVNTKGEIIKRIQATAEYYTEDLGNGVTLEMVSIPGGEFMMGTDDAEIERLCQKFNRDWFREEAPQHKVTVKPFFMGKYPITQAQWEAIASRSELKVETELELNPARFEGSNHPVELVSWYDAVEFCARLSRLTKKEYQLPSEAEWEYACRAIQNSKFKIQKEESIQNSTYPPFHFGETITSELANYIGIYTYAEEPEGVYRKETSPVGTFPPNAFGLYDMHGNVWEWCEDDWHENYEGAPTDGSAWITEESNTAVVRGGSWVGTPYDCRSAKRLIIDWRSDGLYNVGFRVVCGLGRTL